MLSLLGKKIGMTQIFDEKGSIIPVTVLEIGPCTVLGKNKNNILVGFEEIKKEKLKKPQQGFFAKIGVSPKRYTQELPADKDYKIGDELKVDLFEVGGFVDVSGISIGKGFQGGMKRWNWSGGPESHGSMSHRRVGSIGSSSDPSRVFKGHHMPGHMGTANVTVQNLEIVKIQPQENLIAIRGAVPGHKNGIVIINTALKRKKKAAVVVASQTKSEQVKAGPKTPSSKKEK